MPDDLIAMEGAVMLGSRLKRLAERLQAGAELIARDCGLATQPSEMALLAALDRAGPMTVGEATAHLGISQPAVTRLVRQLGTSGLVESQPVDGDRRARRIGLTARGAEAMGIARTIMWPRLRAAVAELCDAEALLREVAAAEAALAAAPLEQRPQGGLAIRRFSDALAPHFDRINREWIEDMYALEQVDIDQLEHPRANIVTPGGDILFVEDPTLGIVGTCGLLKTGPREFELIKMGVSRAARGRKAGEFLLGAAIERAFAMGAERLFLLTNKKSEAAIHLYQKLGFVHDADLLASCGGEYERCDVAMLYRGPLAA